MPDYAPWLSMAQRGVVLHNQVFVPDVCWYSLTPCGHTFQEDDPVFAAWKGGEDHIDLNTRLSKAIGRLRKPCPIRGCPSEVAKLFISQDAPVIIRQAREQTLAPDWDQDYVVPGCCGQLMTEAQLHQMSPNEYHVAPGKVNVGELNTALTRLFRPEHLTCTHCDQRMKSIGRAVLFSAKVRQLLPERLDPLVDVQQEVPPAPPSAPPPEYNPQAYYAPPPAQPIYPPQAYPPPQYAQAGYYPLQPQQRPLYPPMPYDDGYNG